MTDEVKHRSGWLVACGGIPLAVLATWVFLAGGMRSDLQATMATARDSEKLNQMQEVRLTKHDMSIERTREDITEMKADVKDIKKMMQERKGQL